MIISRGSAAADIKVSEDLYTYTRHAVYELVVFLPFSVHKQICQSNRTQQTGKSSYPLSTEEMTWTRPSVSEVCVRACICVCVCVFKRELNGLDIKQKRERERVCR